MAFHVQTRLHMMERHTDEHGSRLRSDSEESNPPTYGVTNENWRGKNDPAERRRIQNRLNQRAFRMRQRAGESPKQYKPRSTSRASSIQSTDEAQTPPADDNTSSGRVWDELARIINRNFMNAAASNTSRLGVNLTALRSGHMVLTPRHSTTNIVIALQPVELQHQVPHDPIIDTIPHARFRFNIVRAIASAQVDPVALSQSLRASGSLENVHGLQQRTGLVVWSAPELLESWELTENFVRRWMPLLSQGCEDLLAATNAWRSRRGERALQAVFLKNG